MLTKACVWGQNLYNAGKARILEQEYIDVSRRRLGRSKLDLLQFYWHDYRCEQCCDPVHLSLMHHLDMSQRIPSGIHQTTTLPQPAPPLTHVAAPHLLCWWRMSRGVLPARKMLKRTQS